MEYGSTKYLLNRRYFRVKSLLKVDYNKGREWFTNSPKPHSPADPDMHHGTRPSVYVCVCVCVCVGGGGGGGGHSCWLSLI